MTYSQLTYYHKNKNNILEKLKVKNENYSKLNAHFKVNKQVGRGGYKWKGEKIKCMKVKKDKFIISFD